MGVRGLDEATLEQLYVRLEKPLYNLAYRWLWNREDARDTLQEAFVRLWRMRRRVDPESVEPLVYRIALNLIASRRRWSRLRRWLSLDVLREPASRDASAEELVSSSQTQARLREAVEALPEELRQVILLCEFSELRYEDVAKLLSIPAGTVGSRRHRAIRLLRRRLGEAL